MMTTSKDVATTTIDERLIFADVETCSLDIKHPVIIQIAAIAVDAQYRELEDSKSRSGLPASSHPSRPLTKTITTPPYGRARLLNRRTQPFNSDAFSGATPRLIPFIAVKYSDWPSSWLTTAPNSINRYCSTGIAT